MQRTFVESSTLRSAGHDAQSAILELQFRNGAVYLYGLVPRSVYRDLLGSPSQGAYFNQNIRGKYPYQRVQRPSSPRH
jgi:hypothetical protein